MQILYAALVLGGAGLVCGLLLAIAAKYLAVETDERVEKIVEILPNANCGGCGFAGCGAFAQAVVDGKADPSACAAGGAEAVEKIADIMGVEVDAKEPAIAVVLCQGTHNNASVRYEYDGIDDCLAAARLGGGQKACTYACLGFGNCVKACAFDAIKIVNGVAVTDSEKCTGCGSCVEACPKGVIKLIPKKIKYFVGCSSKDKGAAMKEKCTAGCIGCKICEKNCPDGAIAINDNLAVIDYEKCTGCGICAEKCPKKIITERV